MAKLTAMGFKLGAPEYIPGEEDWVYGILVKGKHVVLVIRFLSMMCSSSR